MSEKEKTKSTLYIKDTELHLLLSIDYKGSNNENDISLIRDKYSNLKSKLDNLTETVNRNSNLLLREKERLASNMGELSLSEEEIRTLKNELFVLRKKMEKFGDPVAILDEFDRQEAALAELSEKETSLTEDISKMDIKVRDNLQSGKENEKRLGIVSMEISEKAPERKKLEEELAGMEDVAGAFVEKGRFEAELADLKDNISNRSEAAKESKDSVNQTESQTRDLESEIDSLRTRKAELERKAEEVKTLLKEREELKSETDTLEKELSPLKEKEEGLREELGNSEGALKELSEGNTEMRETITAVEEGIARFSQTIAAIKKAKESKRESDKVNEQVTANLERVLLENKEIGKELTLMDEIRKSLVNLVEAEG